MDILLHIQYEKFPSMLFAILQSLFVFTIYYNNWSL
jgi:hypothetical protein